MAPSHVPSDHLPMQGQNIYADPAFENLFPAVEQYGTASWNPGQLNHHSGLPANTSTTQSWHHSSFPQQPYSSISQPYGNASHGYQTASPYQYGQFSNHGSMGSYSHPQAVDPALAVDPMAIRQQQQSPYQVPVRNPTPQGQSSTVTPQALQQGSPAVQSARPTGSPFQIPKTTTELFAQRATPTITKPVQNPKYEVPQGKKSGGFYILDQAALAAATKSNALNKLVTFGSEPLHLPANRTALPLYTPRQSVKDLKKAGADKKLAKKSLSVKAPHSISAAAKNSAGSPSALKKEVSDSESYTESSDDESEYSSDGESEPSPLPAARPDEPHEAVRYDVIKATWFPRKSSPSSEKIKASMRELWEVLATIQKRWRADSKAVQEAEEQKKNGELPVLKSRVTSQRDLLQTALRSALNFGHPDVLHHMGQIKAFLYLCYQFLANRFKMQDHNGPLPSVIFEMLVQCVGTLTTELLEETKVIKALNSMKKNANEKNKGLIQQIIDGAAAGSKKPKVSSPPQTEPMESKNVKRPAAQPAARPTTDGSTAKRLKPSETMSNPAKKPAAAAPAARTTATSNSLPQKRPGEKTAPAPVKSRGNQVVNKPSTFFSSLNAASKKPPPPAAAANASKPNTQPKPAPTASKDKKPIAPAPNKPAFSFAETMAELLKPKEEAAAPAKPEKQLPPETPEEKAKRERKESRRHLRVKFRPDTTLVEVRIFDHFPEEEQGHDENFVRDAGDIGGEGRMFKQHRDMDMEEDDDDLELENRPWAEPSNVDFSRIDPEERKRNYEPYGGGECKPTCPEKEANQRRENSTLMVFYTHPSDIPTSPREPLESQSDPSTTVIEFGAPPKYVLDRSPKPTTPDFSSLEKIFSQFAAPSAASQPTASQPAYAPPPSTTPAATDLSAILRTIQNTSHPAPPAPAQAPAPPQQAPLDISAILSVLQAPSGTGTGAGAATLPPPPPGWPAFPPSFPQQQQQQQGSAPYQAQQPQYDHQHTNGGTKRQREDGKHGGERGHGSFKKQKGHKYHGDRPHKVIACKFFKTGQCTKGDDCTFIHDVNV